MSSGGHDTGGPRDDLVDDLVLDGGGADPQSKPAEASAPLVITGDLEPIPGRRPASSAPPARLATGDLIPITADPPARLATGDLQMIVVPPTADLLGGSDRPTVDAPPPLPRSESPIMARRLSAADVEAADRMTEPVPPIAESERHTIDAGEGELFGIAVPVGIELSDPLSPSLFRWLNTMVKAVRGLRFYADNNATLREYVDGAVYGLLDLLDRKGEISLAVKEDRMLYGEDVVHVNADRVDGLPFILFRNSIRRMTFLRGIDKAELIQLMTAIMTDFNTHELAGEDLVSTLWRLNLPHFKYASTDALSVAAHSAPISGGMHGAGDEVDIHRLQADIDSIIAALSTNEPSPDDIMAGLSLTGSDLDAYQSVRSASGDDDKDLFDFAKELGDGLVREEALDALTAELYRHNNHDALVYKIVDLIVEALIRGETGENVGAATEVLVQLFDATLRRRLYNDATALVSRLRRAEAGAQSEETHAASRLLETLSSESRLIHAINAMNAVGHNVQVSEILEFMRAFGQHASTTLLGLLDFLEQPPHRRVVCDIIAECGMPDVSVLLPRMTEAKAPVAMDILGLASRLSDDQMAPLLLRALDHIHPRVRAQAVGYLRGYPHGTADALLAKAIRDPEFDVRVSAIRVAAARKSVEAAHAIEESLEEGDVFERDPREQRMMMTAFAKIGGDEAVPCLGRVLTPGLFARRRTVDAQTAAAAALGMIHSEAAEEALKKGARTLNKRVRDACRKALAREAVHGDGETDLASSTRPTLAVDSLAEAPIHEPLPPQAAPRSTTQDERATVPVMKVPAPTSALPIEPTAPVREAPARLPTAAMAPASGPPPGSAVPVAPVAPGVPLAPSLPPAAPEPLPGAGVEAPASVAPGAAAPRRHEPLHAPLTPGVDLTSDLGDAAPARLPSSALSVAPTPDDLLDAYEVEEWDEDDVEDETLRASPLAEPIKPPVPGRDSNPVTKIERHSEAAGAEGDDEP